MSIYIGIDPGLSGAIAVLQGDLALEVFDMPTFSVKRGKGVKKELDLGRLADIIYRLPNARAWVELVGAMPGQGVSSMFSFGKSYGATLGILAAFEVPVTHVAPQVWKRAMQVRGGKDASRMRASELFPAYQPLWGLVKHDGRAEAALIASYGRIQNGGKA